MIQILLLMATVLPSICFASERPKQQSIIALHALRTKVLASSDVIVDRERYERLLYRIEMALSSYEQIDRAIQSMRTEMQLLAITHKEADIVLGQADEVLLRSKQAARRAELQLKYNLNNKNR